MVVDCDVHQGNGTAAIFAGDPTVFTLSIHQFNNYPAEKPPSSLDIHLPDGAGDEEYLHRLGDGYRAALSMFQPDLVLYVAGADPFCEDQLGGLRPDLRRTRRARPPGALDGPQARHPGGRGAGRRLRRERLRHRAHPRLYGRRWPRDVLERTGWASGRARTAYLTGNQLTLVSDMSDLHSATMSPLPCNRLRRLAAAPTSGRWSRRSRLDDLDVSPAVASGTGAAPHPRAGHQHACVALSKSCKLSIRVVETIFHNLRHRQLLHVDGMMGNDYQFRLTQTGRRWPRSLRVGPVRRAGAGLGRRIIARVVQAQAAQPNVTREDAARGPLGPGAPRQPAGPAGPGA